MAEVPVPGKGLLVGESDTAGEAEAEGERVPDGVTEGETDAPLLPVEEEEESLLPETAGVAVEVSVCAAAVAVASTLVVTVAGALPVCAVALALALGRDEAELPRLALAEPEGECPTVSRAEDEAVVVLSSDAVPEPVALAEALEAPPPPPLLRVAWEEAVGGAWLGLLLVLAEALSEGVLWAEREERGVGDAGALAGAVPLESALAEASEPLALLEKVTGADS